MQGSKSLLQHFFKQDFFKVPLYQRNYDWRIENCETLFDDIIDVYELSNSPNSELKYRKHFLGTIMHMIDQDTGYHVVIDGQQRIITMALLLAAVRDALIEEVVTSSDPNLIDKLDRKLKDQYDGSIFIKPVEKDRIAYNAIITDDRIPRDEFSNIVTNYDYFKNKISRLVNITLDEFMEGVEKLYIMPILLNSRDDDAQMVFESINSTGLSLSEGDKIRNYMLMSHNPRDQKKYYERYWVKIDDGSFDISRFFRDYITAATGKIPRINDVYLAFKKHYRFQRSDEDIFEKLFVKIVDYSDHYRSLVEENLDYISDDASRIMFRINHQEATVTYPFLMRMLNYHKLGNISDNDVAQILSVIENYLLRRSICEIPTNSLNRLFANLFSSLVDDEPEMFTERLKYSLLEKKGRTRYPRDNEVLYHLKESDMYIRRTTCIHVLSAIENANRDTVDTLARVDSDDLTVEHVMPQTLSREWIDHLGENYEEIHETWLHRLGNITLTAYNTKYSNYTYDIKRNLENFGFKDSGLRLNRIMRESEYWNEEVIEKRNIHLANRFITLMPEFESSYEPPVKNYEDDVYTLEDDANMFTGLIIRGYVFKGETHPERSAIDAYISLLKIFYNEDSMKFKALERRKKPGQVGLWLSSDSSVKDDDLYGKIAPGMWAYKHISNRRKARILKDFISSYDVDPEDVAFVGKRREHRSKEIRN